MATLTEDQVGTVQRTWATAKSTASLGEIGISIFLRFFEYCPEAQQLFPFRDETREELKTSKHLRRHGANFVRHIDQAVQFLDDFNRQGAPMIRALGMRHYNHGAKAPHYDLAGVAFLDTLGDLLREEFTPSVKASWVLMYGIVRDVMLAGSAAEENLTTDQLSKQ